MGFNDKGMLDRYRRPKLAWEAIRGLLPKTEYGKETRKKGKRS